MAGFWPQSLAQFHDVNGKPYPGAKAYFTHADTVIPLTVFRDYGLGSPHPNPVEADGLGIFPAVFLDEDDLFYRVRILTATGVTIAADLPVMPIIGPTAGDGGEEVVPVDPDAVARTGDMKARYDTGAHSGWVRMNAKTIGAAASGATERANSDCQALFLHLWGLNAGASVVGGAGASAAADWSANKEQTIPDWRSRSIRGLDDMGNAAAGRLGAVLAGTTLGGAGGTETVTLALTQVPAHDHGGATGIESADHTHQVPYTPIAYTPTGGSPNANSVGGASTTASSGRSAVHTHAIASAGGGQAHSNLPPTALATIYIKL